jgi:membrane-bound lytic murein transglycosylase D
VLTILLKSKGRKLITFILIGFSFFSLQNVFASNAPEGIQVYQHNLALLPEHRQQVAEDLYRYQQADNIWDVLREEFTLPHYEDSPAVQEKIQWFMSNQDFLLRSATRAAPYLYYILQQVKKRHLPAEIVLLPIIESGYNPFSLSNMGAAGIWQLMPGTASGLGIRRDSWYDGRRDVIASTRGALNYLAYLQSFFEGNWLYAIAAYNTGEGNVLTAIKRNIRDGRDTDFWSLPVAQQTRDYVPSLLALAVIISHPEQYPIYFPPVRNAPYLAQVDTGGQMNLKLAASLAGLSYQRMMQLNPGFNHPSVLTKGPSKLVLPIENVEQFTQNLNRSTLNTNILNWVHYKTKPGDTLASIAKKFDTNIIALRKLNHINKNTIHARMNLLIPVDNDKPTVYAEDDTEARDVPRRVRQKLSSLFGSKTEQQETPEVIEPVTDLAQNNVNYNLQPGDTIYMVRRGDTLENVAQHFHIPADVLKTANHINGHTLPIGRTVIIPTHPGSNNLQENNEYLMPGDTIYLVRKGDTLDKIAQKFHITASSIRITNLIDENSLAEGERLVIPTHLNG